MTEWSDINVRKEVAEIESFKNGLYYGVAFTSLLVSVIVFVLVCFK